MGRGDKGGGYKIKVIFIKTTTLLIEVSSVGGGKKIIFKPAGKL